MGSKKGQANLSKTEEKAGQKDRRAGLEAAIEGEIRALMEELKIGYFPAKDEMYEAGRSGLYGRINRSGGLRAWARRMDLPTRTEAMGPKKSRNPRRKAPSLCWRCAHAVPNPAEGRGCQWSRFFRAVPGWTVEICTLPNIGKTPNVRQCPKFRKG